MMIHPAPSSVRWTEPSQTNASIENESMPTQGPPFLFKQISGIAGDVGIVSSLNCVSQENADLGRTLFAVPILPFRSAAVIALPGTGQVQHTGTGR